MIERYEVRQAEPGDEKELAAIDALCFADAWSEDAFHRELYDNIFASYLVAVVEDRIAGYVGWWFVGDDEGHITNVAVHPDFRGEGIAKVLLKLMIQHCALCDVTALTLEVRPTNEAAIALYTRCGFKEEGRRPHYYEDNGEDAIIMWRRAAK